MLARLLLTAGGAKGWTPNDRNVAVVMVEEGLGAYVVVQMLVGMARLSPPRRVTSRKSLPSLSVSLLLSSSWGQFCSYS